eukprot:355877-Chlamydomonas_euryale.AAC.3
MLGPAPGTAPATTAARKPGPAKPSRFAAALTIASAQERLAADAADAAPPPDAWPPTELREGLEFVAAPATGNGGSGELLARLQSLSMGGFCPVSLAKTGVLRTSQPSVGMLREASTGQLLGFGSAAALAGKGEVGERREPADRLLRGLLKGLLTAALNPKP